MQVKPRLTACICAALFLASMSFAAIADIPKKPEISATTTPGYQAAKAVVALMREHKIVDRNAVARLLLSPSAINTFKWKEETDFFGKKDWTADYQGQEYDKVNSVTLSIWPTIIYGGDEGFNETLSIIFIGQYCPTLQEMTAATGVQPEQWPRPGVDGGPSGETTIFPMKTGGFIEYFNDCVFSAFWQRPGKHPNLF